MYFLLALYGLNIDLTYREQTAHGTIKFSTYSGHGRLSAVCLHRIDISHHVTYWPLLHPVHILWRLVHANVFRAVLLGFVRGDQVALVFYGHVFVPRSAVLSAGNDEDYRNCWDASMQRTLLS